MPPAPTRVHWKRGKRRVAHRHKRPDQLIDELVRDHSGMWGTHARGQVWIGATRRQAYLLEQTCLGRRARGGAERGVPLTPNGTGIELVVRVCCEDAYYMCAMLGVLRVSEAVEGREMEVRLGTGAGEMDARVRSRRPAVPYKGTKRRNWARRRRKMGWARTFWARVQNCG